METVMDRRHLLTTAAALGGLSLLPAGPVLAGTGPKKKTATVNGAEMAYIDAGEGRPVVFLHGNPTSSHLWRGVIPHVSGTHRAIAPDLIGMGDSSKPDIGYTYSDHAEYLHALLDQMDLDDAILVIHDWGSALGLHYARLNPDRIAAVAFMEAILPPAMPFESYAALGPFEELIRTLRTEGVGEKLVLEENFFIEEILRKMAVKDPIPEDVMQTYRAPFPTPQSRLPTLQWPREIPIGGEPANVDAEVRTYSEWFLGTDIPKLMFHVDPGALIPPPAADWLKANLSNLDSVFLGAGVHFVQEDYPDEIGKGLADWLTKV